MRLGRVLFSYSYVVDIDDEKMVKDAKKCLFEDVHDITAGYVESEDEYFSVAADCTASEDRIPEFLRPEGLVAEDYCLHCGRVFGDDNFCGSCGKKRGFR